MRCSLGTQEDLSGGFAYRWMQNGVTNFMSGSEALYMGFEPSCDLNLTLCRVPHTCDC